MATIEQARKWLEVCELLGIDPNRVVDGSMQLIKNVIVYQKYDGLSNPLIRAYFELTDSEMQQVEAIMAAPTRPDWRTYFQGIAKAASARADCTRRKVGAVLVDTNNRILSVGYNGAPAGQPGCLSDGACPRGQLDYTAQPEHGSYDNCTAIHAEANALLYAGQSARGATMYITDAPCPDCAKLLKAAGVGRVVWSGEGSDESCVYT